MNQSLLVTKRDGTTERINLDKIHRVLDWAAEGLNNVSISQVELRSHIQFYDGIKTSDIHETIIKAAADLISREAPDYQYLAARLAIFHLRKKAYGQFEPPKLYDHVVKMVELGKYDTHLLEDYTEEEFEQMNGFIDHWRDMNFSYAAVKQLEGKYLVQNRVTGEIYESAQFLYILVAACLFSNYPRDTRLEYVKRFYDAVSTFKISLPTPIMSGVRTPTRQFSSCVLIECGDSLDSINATSSAIVKYVSQRAGIGINAGRIRALGSPIRGGEAFHTGCIPFYKHFQTAVKSCSQGGVRGGAATLFYPMWHLEVESLLVLKNNRGVEACRSYRGALLRRRQPAQSGERGQDAARRGARRRRPLAMVRAHRRLSQWRTDPRDRRLLGAQEGLPRLSSTRDSKGALPVSRRLPRGRHAPGIGAPGALHAGIAGHQPVRGA